MRKVEMAEAIAKMLAPNDRREETRIYRHHMGRTLAQVRESYQRQKAIEATTQEEIDRHCQPGF